MSTQPTIRIPWLEGQAPQDQPPPKMAQPTTVDPHEAITAPLGPMPDNSKIDLSPFGEQKPNVTSPRQQMEQHDQQRIQEIDNPKKATGFWGKLGHGLNTVRNIAESSLVPTVAMNDPTSAMHQGMERMHDIRELEGLQKQDSEDTAAAQQNVARNSENELRSSQAKHADAETEEIADAPAPQGPDLAHAYSAAVQSALAKGVDPQTDPVVQHIADAITNIQKEPAAKGLSYQTTLGPDGKPHTFGIDSTGKKVADEGIHYERPAVSLNMGGSGNDSLIQAIGEGRVAPPNPRSAQGAALLAQVAQRYPNYDASTFATQETMRKNATSGKIGQSINSLNTINEHLDAAAQNLPSNGSIPLMNTISNAASRAIGGTPTKQFDTDANAISGEWSKLFNGGVATEGEVKHINELLNSNQSPTQLHAALKEVRALTNSKLDALKEQIGSGALPSQTTTRGISSLQSGPKEGGTIKARDPQGKLHEAPAGTKLPQGWKEEK